MITSFAQTAPAVIVTLCAIITALVSTITWWTKWGREWWKALEWPHSLAARRKRWRLEHRIRTDVLNILVEYEASLFKTLNERPKLGMFQSAHERANQLLAEVRADVRSNQWDLLFLGSDPEYAPWARIHIPWTTTYEGFLSDVVPQFEGLFVYGWRLRQEHALWKLKHRRGMGHRRS